MGELSVLDCAILGKLGNRWDRVQLNEMMDEFLSGDPPLSLESEDSIQKAFMRLMNEGYVVVRWSEGRGNLLYRLGPKVDYAKEQGWLPM